MKVDVDIVDWASASPLGSKPEEIWLNYLSPKHTLVQQEQGIVAPLKSALSEQLRTLSQENTKYKELDRSVLLAMFTARNLANIQENCGINIGSSRGATSLFEGFFEEFLQTGKTSPKTSPSTTLGNVSSWVAQDLSTSGISMSHSITCSTALHSIANAAAWLNAGFNEQFIAGGTEAPLTPFTISQMQSMRIYAENIQEDFPCKSFDLNKDRNSMVLGEGCGLFLLGKNQEKALASINSIGFATEVITHGSSISGEGQSMEKAMRMALDGLDLNEVDAIVMHAPGTVKGDLAEMNAITSIFGNSKPLLTTNKWKIGHTLGASGALSMEFALLMMQHQTYIDLPWNTPFLKPASLKTILVNAVGFGGNAVSVLLKSK